MDHDENIVCIFPTFDAFDMCKLATFSASNTQLKMAENSAAASGNGHGNGLLYGTQNRATSNLGGK